MAAVEVLTRSGARTLINVDPARTHVWINAAARSWRPLAADAPDLALMGLGDGLFAEPGALRADAQPAPGAYDRSLRIVLTAEGPDARISYERNGRQVDVDGARVELDLVATGRHDITWWARNPAGRSAPQTGRWIIEADPRRDTDGDGIPDRVELAMGRDVFSANGGRDAAALDDWLRNRRPGDAADPDGDGWATFDERLRGTDPEDRSSRPTATERYGVEARYTLAVPDLARVSVTAWTARWQPRSPRGRAGERLAPIVGLDPRELPVLRLPLSAPLVLRATAEERAFKAWQDALPAVNPTRIAVGNWATPDAWAEAIEAELAARLVIDRPLSLDPASTRTVLLWEVLLAHFRGTDGPPLVLGDDALGTDANALDRLIAAWGTTERITEQLAALEAMLRQPLTRAMSVRRPDPHAMLDHRWAAILQQDPESFPVQVVAVVGPTEVLALDPATREALLNAEADADGDGISNAVEVAHRLDPHRADTDGDGVPDGADPCPADGANACRDASDRDADGVLDVFDNCVAGANPNQRDRDGDGIGDVCEERFAAVIVAPANDPIRLTGEHLAVRAAYTADPIDLRWDFDGLAAASDALEPPPIRLDRPGMYRVRLTAGGRTDERVVTVVGPDRTPLDLSVRVPVRVQEGERIRLRPRSTADYVAWDWALGDGARAGSAHAHHAYADDGLYAGRLTAVHADGRVASPVKPTPMETGAATRSTTAPSDPTRVRPTWTRMASATPAVPPATRPSRSVLNSAAPHKRPASAAIVRAEAPVPTPSVGRSVTGRRSTAIAASMLKRGHATPR